MSPWNLRKKPRTISYYEPEEPPLDEYIYCDQCADIVYEYCAIHGPLLVVLDDKVPAKTGLPSFVPRAALTIPQKFLHLAPSIIPGAGIGVFSTMTLPKGVRFGPYRGKKEPEANTDYCWQIYNKQHKASHVIDAQDANKSNWMRYVNCARHWCEQNLVAFQYQGQLYYRTVKVIPRFTELMVFYGSEFANYLNIDMRLFNCVAGLSKLTIAMPRRREVEENNDQCKPTVREAMPAPTTDVIQHDVTENIQNNPIDETSAVFDKTRKIEHPNAVPVNCNKNLLVDSNVLSNKIIITEQTQAVTEDINNNLVVNPTTLSNEKSQLKVRKTCFRPNENTTQGATAIKKIKMNEANDNKKNPGNDIEKNIYCALCQFRTNSRFSLNYHNMSVHTGDKPYKCTHCASTFTARQSLKRHERIHTGEKSYQCTYCSSAFKNGSHLKTHERIHTGEKPYQCTHCASAFTQINHLKRHERIHTGEKSYQCTYCSSAFKNGSHLKTHERIHTGEKPYQCTHCASAFTQINHLKRHERIHTGEKPYQCTHCASAFTQFINLKTHERIHTGEKPYQCTHCASAFTQFITLKTHERTHTGEKPYQCTYCSSAFKNGSHLKTHERIHTGEKPYQCTHCASAFTQINHLKTHERIHTGEKPYQCTHCASAFTQFINLKTHERIHTGEKPYQCTHCASAFTQINHLKTHERIHRGEKPYQCTYCSSAFEDASSLKTHERLKHLRK